MQEQTTQPIVLIKGGSYSHEYEFEAPDGSLLDLSGRELRMLVKWNSGGVSGAAEWKTSAGHFTIVAGTQNKRANFALTTAQINALEFKAATYYFFLDGENDFLFDGTIQVR